MHGDTKRILANVLIAMTVAMALLSAAFFAAIILEGNDWHLDLGWGISFLLVLYGIFASLRAYHGSRSEL